jgi:hypothetical protein
MQAMKRFSILIAAGLLVASVVVVAPVSAQGRSAGCTQATGGGGGAAGGGGQGANNPSNSTAVLTGLVDVLVQNVQAQALNNLNLNALNDTNVQVVCLNDVLNQNDVRILQNILNDSPILNQDLNNSLNGNTVLTGILNNNNIADNVQVVAVNLGTGQVFVLGA